MSLKRLNYFKGQFLKAKDFQDEQEYHIENQKNHSKNLHTWGIIKGLMVNEIERGIVVNKGIAVDREGRMLILEKPEYIETSAFQSKFFYIILSYHEQGTDAVTETGITGNTRISEEPKIEMPISADPKMELALAKVKLNDHDKIEIDLTCRRYSGISFFAENEPYPEITGKIFGNNEYGIYFRSPWVEMDGRLKTKGLAISGNTVLGDTGDEDHIIVNGVIYPRRQSNATLPPNKVPGSKLQISGDIEFQQILSAPNDMIISSMGDISLVCPKGIYIKKSRDRGNLSGNLVVEGNLTVAGMISAVSKQFVIKHPLHSDRKYLVHSTLEGPEIAVFYRGESQLVNGEVVVNLPEYFEALTHKEQRTVLLTPIHEGQEAISSLSASLVRDGKFTVKMIGNSNPFQKFYWEVKAVRADVPILEVEKM